MRESLRRTAFVGLVGVLAGSCVSVPHRTQASVLGLRLGEGDSLVYQVEIRCSTDVWPQQDPVSKKGLVKYTVSEAGELGYLVQAQLITDTNRISWQCDITSSGKVLDQSLPADMDQDWRDALDMGLVPFTVQLPMQPVSPGATWQTNVFHGVLVCTYRGTGFLLGRFGHLLELNLNLQRQNRQGFLNASMSASTVARVSSGIITGSRSWCEITRTSPQQEKTRKWISCTAVAQ